MYRMTLKEQTAVLARITALAPHDRERSEAIAAVQADRATAVHVRVVLAALRRYAELGRGLERSEARRALEPDGDVPSVRWYDAGPKNHRV